MFVILFVYFWDSFWTVNNILVMHFFYFSPQMSKSLYERFKKMSTIFFQQKLSSSTVHIFRHKDQDFHWGPNINKLDQAMPRKKFLSFTFSSCNVQVIIVGRKSGNQFGRSMTALPRSALHISCIEGKPY